eukprot:TRINITY_DN55572_c0_g1_i1.p1 TRINITY_DN55572_c0_g1~~TRINITY_DN55572_c0_g1_i1.p1  ORF type:complete len:134 (-),score=15.04 TRINITY_DN55572_c0_g1_i1:57-401(-)
MSVEQKTGDSVDTTVKSSAVPTVFACIALVLALLVTASVNVCAVASQLGTTWGDAFSNISCLQECLAVAIGLAIARITQGWCTRSGSAVVRTFRSWCRRSRDHRRAGFVSSSDA